LSIFTNSITNIVNSGYINQTSSQKQLSQIAESIKNGAIDTVSFSDESKNLFQISQIDTMLNGIFGIPNDLDANQLKELQNIRASLDVLNPNNSSQLEIIDFEKVYKNLGLNDANKKQIESITNEFGNYLTQRSVSQLFGNENSLNLASFSDGFNTLLGEKLTSGETEKLGTLSIQLNRLLFNSKDNQVSSYLNIFNDLLGLNNPNEEEIFNASSLLTQRNTLLSSSLINKSYQSTY